MKKVLFPLIVIILPHMLLTLLFLHDIPNTFILLLYSVISILGGISAIMLIHQSVFRISEYLAELLTAVSISVLLTITGCILFFRPFLDEHVILFTSGMMLIPLVSSFRLLHSAKSHTDRFILILVNPLTYAVLLEFSLLLCLYFTPSVFLY